MSRQPVYFATEFSSIRPTRNFNRAQLAAEREADSRRCPVWVFENGRQSMLVHPARYGKASS